MDEFDIKEVLDILKEAEKNQDWDLVNEAISFMEEYLDNEDGSEYDWFMLTIIIILTVVLTVSICANIYFFIKMNDLLDVIETMQQWNDQYKNLVENTYRKLKEIDEKQIFEKDDDVGFVFSEIVRLIELIKEKSKWKNPRKKWRF